MPNCAAGYFPFHCDGLLMGWTNVHDLSPAPPAPPSQKNKNTASHPVIVSARAFMCDRSTFYENATHGPAAVLGRAFIHKEMQNLKK